MCCDPCSRVCQQGSGPGYRQLHRLILQLGHHTSGDELVGGDGTIGDHRINHPMTALALFNRGGDAIENKKKVLVNEKFDQLENSQ